MKPTLRHLLDGSTLVVILFVMITAGLGLFLHRYWIEKQNDYFSRNQANLNLAYQASVQIYRLAMDGFFTDTINRPEIAKLFAEGAASSGAERNMARGKLYRKLYSTYVSLQSNKLIQLHFHTPDGKSYLRFHKPETYGDSLLEARPSVRIVNEEKRSVYGFETGKARAGFRYLYPVHYKQRHIGNVEVSVTTKAIIDAMAEFDSNHEYAFLMNRLLVEPYILEEEKWLYTPSEIHPDLMVEDAEAVLPSSPPKLSESALAVNHHIAGNKKLKKALSDGRPFTLGTTGLKEPYIVTLIPIQDVAERVAGYLVGYKPDRTLTTFRREYLVYMTTTIAALVLITLLIFRLQKRSAALARERRNLQITHDTLAEGVFVMDLNGIILHGNPAVTRMLGYEIDELIGQSAHDLLHVHPSGESFNQLNCPLHNHVTKGLAYDAQEMFRHKNGSIRIVELATRPIKINGSMTGSVTALHDITERQEIIETLREKELFQRTLMNHLPVGLIIIDAETRRIEMVNPTALEMLGTVPSDAIGKVCHRFLCPSDEKACPILDLKQNIDNSQRVLLRYDGTSVPVLKTVNVVTSQGRKKMLECFVDISIRVTAEKALKKANDQLRSAIVRANDLADKAKSANRAKSVFLANMSHEIRTPLNAILGYSQLLQMDNSLHSDHLEQVKIINRSGDHLLELINSVLEMSKIEAGYIRVQNEKIDFTQLLEDVRSIFQLTCRKKNLSLVIERKKGTPGQILGDHGKIRQVLINLISNAVKFTTAGGIKVSVGAVLDKENWAMTLDVIDTGEGIAAEDHSRLFEPFEQTTTGQQAPEGTGLGLPISRAYARAMGGDLIMVESRPGKGSAFRFTFTAHTGKADAVQRTEDHSGRIIGLAPQDAGLRVLVVEDDTYSREFVNKLLTDIGFMVATTDRGGEALQLVEDFRPRVVLLDLQLPGINGFETAKRMRDLADGRKMAVIVVSASAMYVNDLQEKAAASGINGFVSKPFTTGKLLEEIKRITDIKYLYQSEPPVGKTETATISQRNLQHLPPQVRQKLRMAVQMGDMTTFTRMAEEAAATAPELIGHLTLLARRFDYTALLELLSDSEKSQRVGDTL